MGVDCVFCKIIEGAIASPRVFEDSDFICIRDIQPQAPTHLLLIPKVHLVSLEEAYPANGSKSNVAGRMLEVATMIARKQGLFPEGFRAVVNTGVNGGQTVFHLHLHVLGGKALDPGLA